MALCAFWTARLVFDGAGWCFLDNVNVVFHEAGHPIFSILGETMMVLGGTLGQLLVPSLLCGYFLGRGGNRGDNRFAAALCAFWFGENFLNVARYMADARDLALPLIGGGDEHDWNRLFYQFGLLGESSVRAVSGATRAFGAAVMLAALAWSVAFLLPENRRGRLAARMPALRFLLG